MKAWSMRDLERLGRGLCMGAALSSFFVYWFGPWVFAVTGAMLAGNHVVERVWRRKWKTQVEADRKELEEAVRS